MRKFVFLLCCVMLFDAQRAWTCDLCALYHAVDASGAKQGWHAGVFEQYTRFGTLRLDGKKIDNEAGQFMNSSITQIVLGYQSDPHLGVQLNVPFVSRSFQRPGASGSETGTVSGLGDATVSGTVTAYRELSREHAVVWDVTTGVKLPTGDSARIGEETAEVETTPESGIHGHDLALGSGSYDGILGTSVYGRVKRFYGTASAQYALRMRGDFGYRFADDFLWSVKPGVYVWFADQGTLGVQFAASGELKGPDTLQDEVMADTGMRSVFLGPEIAFTRGDAVSAHLGADFPVRERNTALQIVPDYRVRGALTWRF